MRGHRRGAIGLAVAVAVLATAGCGIFDGGGSGRSRERPTPAGGAFTVEPGQEVIVYGVRARRCGITPPDFATASGEMFGGPGSQAPEVGEVFDAGEGHRASVPCGGRVPVRAIGYRAPAEFEGEVSMVFYGSDQAIVTVALPEPEPEPEPEPDLEEAPDLEVETEVEPEYQPELEPEVGPALKPELEPIPETSATPDPIPAPEVLPLPEAEPAPQPESTLTPEFKQELESGVDPDAMPEPSN